MVRYWMHAARGRRTSRSSWDACHRPAIQASCPEYTGRRRPSGSSALVVGKYLPGGIASSALVLRYAKAWTLIVLDPISWLSSSG